MIEIAVALVVVLVIVGAVRKLIEGVGADAGRRGKEETCPTCGGAGTVPDNDRKLRGETHEEIRVRG